MINQLKNNNKIKIISLLSAILLWLYVMVFVDPSESKLYENVPVTISNMRDLNDKDLVIYPEIKLTADIYVSGKLSDIQKTKKENIHIPNGMVKDIESECRRYDDFIKEIKPIIEFTILNCGYNCKESLEKLPLKRNKEILQNIINLGMMDKYEKVINRCNCKDKKKRIDR